VTGDRHLWAQTYDRQLDDVFAVQSEIAEKVADNLKVKLLSSEKKALERTPTKDVEAYTLYLKGRYHWNIRSKEEIKKAIEYFQLAVEQDPGFALGFSGLADCYNVMARNGLAEPGIAYPKAKECAKKALELDEKLGEPHAALGSIGLYYDHEYGETESEFRRAIELKPSYSTAYQWYFHLLAAEGRFSEALEQTSKAVELDPISPAVNANHGDALFWIGEYDKSIEQYKKVATLGPKWDWPWLVLTLQYVEKSDFDQALKATEKYGELTDRPLDATWSRAYVYAAMGKKDDCKPLLDEIKGRYREEFVSPYTIGLVYFKLGLIDEGFEWLERAYEDQDPWLVWMGVDRDLITVRSDPRYLSLLERIGLSKYLTRP
jgi:tetratricopeptide (TPR) repeat protein